MMICDLTQYAKLLVDSKEKFDTFKSNAEFNSQLSYKSIYDKKYSVGIKNLPKQTQSMKARKGASLNLLLVGQIGLGKTTFINTLFGTSLLPNIWHNVNQITPNLSFPETTSIDKQKLFLVENNFELDCTVINTPGFCDSIDNQFSYVPITEYIDQQLRLYMFQEEQPDRLELADNRVHACLYFINPTSKGLSTSDIEALRHISNRVNLIPIIAKADTLTLEETKELKELIRHIIEAQEIKICEHIEDDEVKSKILEQVPYTIIGSESHIIKKNGTSVRGRKYEWGVAEVDNEEHCDFTKLKNVLLSTNMIDLISSTESYYERCRDKLLRTRINEAKEKLEEQDELIKDFDFDNIDSNGLRGYKILSKFNKSIVDDLVIEWNPIFVQKQLMQRKKFNEIVAFEEKKFKDWKKALFSKQNLLNEEIEELSTEVKRINEIVHQLQHPVIEEQTTPVSETIEPEQQCSSSLIEAN